MKSIALVFQTAISCLLLTSAVNAQQCPSLFWNDEFDGTELDPTKWIPQIGDGCDLGICGWGNAELQYYRSRNISVKDGTLRIKAVKEDFRGAQYTSSRIQSRGLSDIDLTQPTRVEARVKVPAGQGLWSAAWMLPTKPELTSWPRYGEIDFLEFIGREPYFVSTECFLEVVSQKRLLTNAIFFFRVKDTFTTEICTMTNRKRGDRSD